MTISKNYGTALEKDHVCLDGDIGYSPWEDNIAPS